MDTFITNLNSAGHAFVNFALPMLIQVGILIVILLGLDWLLRKRVKAVIRYGIWMLILVKLLLPPSLTSPTGIGYWLGDKLPDIPSVMSSEVDSSTVITPLPVTDELSQPVTNLDSLPIEATPILDKPATPVLSKSPAPPADTNPVSPEPVISQAETETTPTITETTTPIIWQAIIFLVWLSIVFSLALLLLQRIIFVRSLIAQSETAPGKTMDILQRCREQLNIKRKIILKLSPNTTSPSVCGLFRPVILFPRNLTDRLDSQQLQSVFLHELAHIKRYDLWVSMLQTVLQIIYFYNPLLWLANWKIRRLREQAVDETVLAALGDRAEHYPNTLLDVSKQVFARPALSLRLVGVVESKAALKNRIRHIVTRPFPKSAKLGLLGIAAIIITALILLPMAKAEKQVTDETTLKDSSIKATVPGKEDKPVDKGFPEVGNANKVLAQVKLISGDEEVDQGKYHWKISLPTDSSLESGWFSLINGQMKEYAGGGATLDQTEQMKEIKLETNISEDNFLTLKVTRIYANSEVNKQSAILEYKTTAPVGASLTTERLSRFLFISNLEYSPLWIGNFKDEDKILKTVVICVRVKTANDKDKDFSPNPVVADPRTPYDLNNMKILVSQKEMNNPSRNPSVGGLTEAEKKNEQAEISPPRFTAKLPNGVTVELVGLFTGKSKENLKWWRPNGTPLSKKEMAIYEGYIKPEDIQYDNNGHRNSRQLEFGYVLRFDPFDNLNIDTDKIVGKFVAGRRGPTLSKDGISITFLESFEYIRKQGFPKQDDIHVAAAYGPWEKSESIIATPNNPTPLTLEDGSNIMLSRLRDARNNPQYSEIEVSYNSRDLDIRLFYELKTGKKQHITSHLWMGGPGPAYPSEEIKSLIQESFYLYSVPKENVKQFTVEYRRFNKIIFKNVSLKPGLKTNVQVESPGVIDDTTGLKKVFLPDADTENANVILDLANGQLLPVIQGTEKEVKEFYQNIAKGDLAYEDGLICLRGAKISFRTVKNLWTFSPSSIRKGSPFHNLKALPSHLRITTAEGDDFDVHILSKKVNGLHVAYQKSESNAESTHFHLGLTEEYRKYFQNIQPLIERDSQVIELNQQVEILESQIDELLYVRTMKAIHPTVQTLIFRLGMVQKQLDQRKLQILQEYKRGQKASNVRVDLPNAITVEYLGFGNIVADKLQWWDPNGQPTHIPNVSEADVEGLGTVLAFRLSSTEPTEEMYFTSNKVQGPHSTSLNKRWSIPDSNTWLVPLEAEHRFINLRLNTTRRTPRFKSDVISLTFDRLSVDKPLEVNQFCLKAIYLGQSQVSPNVLHLTFLKQKSATILGITALNNSQQTYRGEPYYKKDHKIPGGGHYKFDIVPSDLVGVTVEYLNFYRSKVIFKNLNLIPGKKADPKIEIIQED